MNEQDRKPSDLLSEEERERYDKERKVIYDEWIDECNEIEAYYDEHKLPGRDERRAQPLKEACRKYNRRMAQLMVKYGIELTDNWKKWLPSDNK